MKRNYRIFTRTWWKDNTNGEWPNNLEPEAGRKKYMGYAETEEEAREICQKWNSEHKAGKYSRKAEFERN